MRFKGFKTHHPMPGEVWKSRVDNPFSTDFIKVWDVNLGDKATIPTGASFLVLGVTHLHEENWRYLYGDQPAYLVLYNGRKYKVSQVCFEDEVTIPTEETKQWLSK